MIKPEIVLECGRGQRLTFVLYGQPFLGLNRLMNAIGPAAPGHGSTRMLIDNNHLALGDHVMIITRVEIMSFQGCMNVME